MNRNKGNIRWVSFCSKSFIVCGSILIAIMFAIGLLTKYANIIVIGVPMGLFFVLLGVIIPFAFKQNVVVAVLSIFCYFTTWLIIIGSALLFLFRTKEASIVVLALAAFFSLFIIAFTIMAKKDNKFYIYTSPTVKYNIPVKEVLKSVSNDLIVPGDPWIINVEDNSIVARINCKDASNISFKNITREMEDFEYRVNLYEDYEYNETFIVSSNISHVSLDSDSEAGNRVYGIASNYYHSIEFGVKQNNEGKDAMIKTYSTDEIRDKIRRYIEERGYKLIY